MTPEKTLRVLLTILCATIIIASFPSTPRAQCGGCESKVAIEPGAWALQFRVTNNFTLDTFEGSVVSAKHHFSKSRAIRFGVSGSLTSDNGDERDRSAIADSVTFDGSNSSKRRSRSVGLSAEYLHYFAPQGRMNTFIGAGPLLRYSWRNSYEHSSVGGDRDYHDHGWNIGASALAGVEWFAARSISFHAEYGLQLIRSWSHGEEVDTRYDPLRTSRSKSSDHRWDLSGSSVQLGVSAYL